MTVLIIEDEPHAADRIEGLVLELQPDARIVGRLDSVKRSVRWFESNKPPDLVLMDIQLADGVSFQIFEQCNVTVPVIFTTAYNEYALRAFKVNSIDYLLKPVDKKELRTALDKFSALAGGHNAASGKMLEQISQAMKMLTKTHKERFVIKVGEHLKSIEATEILFFFSLEKATFAQTRDGRKHIVDFTLDQLQERVDHGRFFRINRKYIVALDAIKDMISYSNSRLRLVLETSSDDDVVVARERVQPFKEWLDR
ncbi:MAG: LytTR family DNA-binding domain-containing protein [Cytophagales bacterium]|nr:LytTR family DNA-binding domain-containing protein [Cytophagales bacterium]